MDESAAKITQNMLAVDDLGLMLALTVVHDFELLFLMNETDKKNGSRAMYYFNRSDELEKRVDAYINMLDENCHEFETFFKYIASIFEEKTDYSVAKRSQVDVNGS